MKIDSRELKVGQRFIHMDKTFICTSNDGFIMTADNVNKEDITSDIMFVGLSEEVELEE